jgi:hypothetical protein
MKKYDYNTQEGKLYLAGFIDGDGSIIAQIVKKQDYVLKNQIRVTVQVTQSTKRKEFLENLKEFFKFGYIRDRKSGVSDWVVVEPAKVKQLLDFLYPLLLLKEEQAKLTLELIEFLQTISNDPGRFLEACRLVDKISSYNDTRKRTNNADSVEKELKDLGIM